MKHYRHFLIIFLILGFFLVGQQVFGQFANDQIVDQIAEKARHSTVLLITEDPERKIKLDDGYHLTVKHPGGRLGSGFFVDHDKIATNIHCVAGETKIRAKLVGTETFYDIEGVIASDPENDFVSLKVAGKGPKLSLGNSDAVREGEPIAAVGSPKGHEGQITHGKVYNRRKSDKWLRLTAKLPPGNSGGPVLSSKGVIGVAAQSVISEYGSKSYAIPSNTLKQLLENSKSATPLNLEEWQQKKPILAYADYGLAQEMFKTGESNLKHQQSLYQKAIELLDKAIEGYRDPQSYLLRGKVYEELEEYQKAIDDYTECINLKPDGAMAYFNRGWAKWKCSLYEKAIKDFEKVIKLIPDDVYSYLVMGNCKLNLERYEEAIADFKKAIELSPNNTSVYMPAYMDMGNCRLKLERYEEAIADFGKVIDLSPNNANAYYNRGRARLLWGASEEAHGRNADAQKQYQAAKEDLNRALQLNPDKVVSDYASDNLKFVKEALERLE